MRCVLIALLPILTLPTLAFGTCPDIPATTFAKDLASAYAANKLGSLDEKYKGLGSIRIVVEHSIGEEEGGDVIFVTDVRSFRDLSRLLESRRTEGLPIPESRPFRRCDNSICTFDFFEGIQHNRLYLKEIRYNDYKSCLEIESIWLLDGD